MIRVVLIYVFCHTYVTIDLSNALVDILKQLAVMYWRREALKNLKNLHLKPRARCHIVIVVLSMVLNVSKDEN